MRRGDGEDERFAVPDLKREVARGGGRFRADEAAVEFARFQRLQLRGGRKVGHFHLAGGELPAELPDQADQLFVEERAHERQPQAPGLTLPRALDGLVRAVHVAEDGAGVLEVKPAMLRERNGVRIPRQKPRLQFQLERLDVPRQRCLRKMKPLRRLGEVEAFRHGEEGFQFADGGTGHA